jgi:hypothetical protein
VTDGVNARQQLVQIPIGSPAANGPVADAQGTYLVASHPAKLRGSELGDANFAI